jgi:medium-chain acyl-[acyl-carrier-protein] hydrolase
VPPPPPSWFPFRQANPQARLRLFCFPYAGGGASIYNTWSAALPPTVELVSVQPPGRERRILEKPVHDISRLVEALEPEMRPLLDKPFVLMGYSMGTRIALALTQRWQARGEPLPLGLMVAAGGAPHVQRMSRGNLNDKDFIELLRAYEGTPAELFAHKELMEMVLPTLRADFALADSVLPATPVRVPIVAYGGLEDSHVSIADLERWRELTTGEFRARHFAGKHFFLRTERVPLLEALREDLTRWAPELAP